jgi:hypothetical protein
MSRPKELEEELTRYREHGAYREPNREHCVVSRATVTPRPSPAPQFVLEASVLGYPKTGGLPGTMGRVARSLSSAWGFLSDSQVIEN